MKLAHYRSITNIHDVAWEPYSRQGQVQEDCSWCNISFDDTGSGVFLFRFDPGARSIAHEHLGWEEFLVVDGEIEECDGTVYHAGDFVSLRPGSKHWSASKNGAVALAFIRGGFRTLERDEGVDL